MNDIVNFELKGITDNIKGKEKEDLVNFFIQIQKSR